MITMLLVDDQPAVRPGLQMRFALEPDLCVVGEAGDGVTAVVLAQTLVPDVVLLDVAMPGMDGIATASAIRTAVPGSCVVLLSLHDDVATQARAQAAGAHAFVAKHDGVDRLLAVVRQVAAI